MVEGKSAEAKKVTQRVGSRAVHPIHFAAYRQMAVVTKRALTPALEDGEDRPVEVGSRAAMIAANGCSGDNPEQHAPATARRLVPAFGTIRHLQWINE